MMDRILNKKHYRSAFFLIIGLILTLSIVVRFLVLPQFDQNLNVGIAKFSATLLDGLVVSLFVTVLIGIFVFWLTPEILKKSVIEVVDPKEIGPLLKKAATDTRSWIYKGACGRYTRAATLPTLAQAARNEGIGRDIRITIMNPSNELLCCEYAAYRRSLKSAVNEEPWTYIKVKEEVIATIIAALIYKHEEPLLRIDVYLTNNFSAFRLDISDHYVVVTKEDKEAAGLRADKGTYFYDSYKDDVRLNERQSININAFKNIPTGENITTESLETVILENNLITDNELRKLDLKKIVDSINTPKDPYS